MRDLTAWAVRWAPQHLRGGLPGREAADVWYQLALHIEAALLGVLEEPPPAPSEHSQPVEGESPSEVEPDWFAGIALDLVKFFDLVPYELLFSLFEHLGMPPEVLRALRGFYREVECRFALGEVLGRWFRKTSGLFQGDPFAMLLILGLTAVLALAILRCGCTPHGYVDDLTPTAQGPEAGTRLLPAASRTDAWLRLTKQRLAPSKTWSFATHPRLRAFLKERLRMGGARIRSRLGGRILGAHISTSRRRQGGSHLTRLSKAARRMERIMRLPHGGGPKQQMVQAAGVACAVYGAEVAALPQRQLASLDAAALKAWWGPL